jgi:cell division septum initiation protein DivIVA
MEELQQENLQLKKRIIELEEHLKKYTNSEGHKRYYEKNKEKVMANASNYLRKLSQENPEKLKEYRKKAYLRRKEKTQKTISNTNPDSVKN